ncbi:hypothetical protein AAF712_015243 [Marasmius tenuissimus]|uniref:Uncharacterized protein n=1 Tax=Marasmius tenuissimus TaxID=585030 RepID=A0ABR2ZB24_9AGAR
MACMLEGITLASEARVEAMQLEHKAWMEDVKTEIRGLTDAVRMSTFFPPAKQMRLEPNSSTHTVATQSAKPSKPRNMRNRKTSCLPSALHLPMPSLTPSPSPTASLPPLSPPATPVPPSSPPATPTTPLTPKMDQVQVAHEEVTPVLGPREDMSRSTAAQASTPLTLGRYYMHRVDAVMELSRQQLDEKQKQALVEIETHIRQEKASHHDWEWVVYGSQKKDEWLP